MVSPLVVCSSCDRHVFAAETRCPFCRSTIVRALASVVAASALLACHKDPPTADVAPAASVAPIEAGPAPSASALSGSDDAGNLVGLGSIAASDGGLGDLRLGAAVYGPAQATSSGGGLGSLGGVRGDCKLGEITATVPVTDANRTLAALRPRLRNAYNRGLQSDPTMTGTATFKLNVAADGRVLSADVKAPGLSADVIKDMKGNFDHIVFTPPGKPSVISGSLTCIAQK